MPLARLVPVFLITAPFILAQTPVPSAPNYEVASIKPNQSGARHAILSYPGGRLVATNATLKDLIVFAWNVREYQISGGPNWLDTTGYDILATPEHAVNPSAETIDAFREMMRGLLSGRFQLTTHFEAKELPVYALVPAKEGPKLKDSGNVQNPTDMSLRGGAGLMTAQHIPLQFVAQQLSDRLGRLVLDKTGLTGHYSFKLEWTPDETESHGDAPPAADHTGPSLFTALQEQLGLKLQAQKAPVPILVIDRAEKASEN